MRGGRANIKSWGVGYRLNTPAMVPDTTNKHTRYTPRGKREHSEATQGKEGGWVGEKEVRGRERERERVESTQGRRGLGGRVRGWRGVEGKAWREGYREGGIRKEKRAQ